MKEATTKLEADLVTKHGASQRERIQRGLKQVTDFWRKEDGPRDVFEEFVSTNFAGDPSTLDQLFNRFQHNLEQFDGHMGEIGREFRRQSDLDTGPILPFDDLFAGYDPSAHATDDFFQNKLAFVVLLNFPLTTLQQRLTDGNNWSRRQWAEARLAQRFSKRIPAEVNLTISQASADSARYIAEYNIWMHHLINEKGERIFPAGLRLLSHWNLRDEIKANYSEGEKGLQKQRTIQQVMERIVTQTIPAVAVNNPRVDWNPFTNDVKTATVDVAPKAGPTTNTAPSNAAEPNTRYAKLLLDFQAVRKADPYSPTAPTFIARSLMKAAKYRKHVSSKCSNRSCRHHCLRKPRSWSSDESIDRSSRLTSGTTGSVRAARTRKRNSTRSCGRSIRPLTPTSRTSQTCW
jgi:hypothetical protein